MQKHFTGFQQELDNKNVVVAHLARELWAAYDYNSPVAPFELANFVVKQIDIAGYKLVKDGDNE